jgi:hypothetical protein
MGLRDLVRREKQLKDNLYRIHYEIAKGDKPHLEQERIKRIKEREQELQMVLKLIND